MTVGRGGRNRRVLASSRSLPSPGLPADLRHFAAAAITAIGHGIAGRRARPHLAMLGIPLAIIAGCLTQPLVVFPLIVCAWWWAPRTLAIEWTVVCGRGLIGMEWALIGINALVAFPNQTLLVGTCWACSAFALGAMAYLFRLRG